MSSVQYYEPESITVELAGEEWRSLTSMSEIRRLLHVLYRPRGKPKGVLAADDFVGRHMELDANLQCLEELGNRIQLQRLAAADARFRNRELVGLPLKVTLDGGSSGEEEDGQ